MSLAYRERLGQELRKARRAKGLNLAELAPMMGISAQALSYYENGKRGMKFDVLEPLAKILDLRVNDLLFLNDKSPDSLPWVCPACGCGNAYWNRTCEKCMKGGTHE